MTQANPAVVAAASVPDAPAAAPLPVVALESDPRPIPIWASLLVIALCLGGGVWIMRWYINSDQLSQESRILDPRAAQAATPFTARPQARAAAAPMAMANTAALAVRKQDETSWWVYAPEAAMLVDTKATPPTIKVINYTNYEFVPQEHRNLIVSARRIARDDAVAKALTLTPEQATKMRALTQQIGMVTEPADQENLKALWAQYQTGGAKAGPAETKLTQSLSELARKSVDRTRQAAADRATKIKGVLTEEQWKQFEAMGR